MSMMAYKATMFMVFFNYAMIIATYIGSVVFPGAATTQPATYGGAILQGTSIFSNFSSASGVNTLSTIALTAGVLALFAFSLLIPTIPFVFLFFGLSGIITNIYIYQLPLDNMFLFPISIGVTIVYYVGITQYAARSAFQGS